jgi:L-cysteine/cystine lyase
VPIEPASVRADLPCLAGEAYLNTGGAGPMSRVVAGAVEAALAEQLGRGRMGLPAITAARERQAALRTAIGRLLGRPAAEVAIAQSTTHAMNQVIWGIDWRPGDEVVTTALEHPGLLVPLGVLARRMGVTLRVLDAGDGSGPLEERVAGACSPRTRLVALSHVAYGTGARLDVEGAVRAAHAAGALVLVDGAQGAGAVPADPGALGCDAYALPAQKWLMGPEGLGALWIAPEAMERVDVTVSGYETGGDHGTDGSVALHPDARRYEASTHPEVLIAGWLAALGWLERLGHDAVHRATLAAAAACRARLGEIPGVRILGGPEATSGLVAFTVDGWAPEPAAAALAVGGVTVRWLADPPALRASCAFFTGADDLDRLATGVRGRGEWYRPRP